MPQEPNTPDNSVPREPDVSSREGERNGDGGDKVANLFEVVNEVLGTKFKDDEAAVAGLKETSTFVGKLNKYRPYLDKLETSRGGEKEALAFMQTLLDPKPETPAAKPRNDEGKFVPVEKYEADLFFGKHADLADHQPLLEALKAANPDKTWDEVVELPAFKTLYEKAKQASEGVSEGLRSNARVSTPQSQDYQKDLEEAQASGNWVPFLAKHKGTKLQES